MNAPEPALKRKGLSRRDMLVAASVTTGGSLLVACSPADILALGAPDHFGPFGPFIQIARDGAVTVVSKHIEFGQGNHAGLAAIVAEELDADWDKVKVVQAPANAKVYANTGFGMQGTGGSSAIANSWTQLRTAGAAARAMFVSAAADAWKVPASEIVVKDGVLTHPSGKSAPFGDLVDAAAKVSPPQKPAFKDPSKFTLIGTDRVRRKDAKAKSEGAARYTQDVHLPNMLTAVVAHSPRFKGKVKSFNADAARKVPGVVDVVQIPTGVAVLAKNTWSAKQGRDALKVEWDDSKAVKRGSADIRAEFRAIASGERKAEGEAAWKSFAAKGKADPGSGGGKVVEASFDFPYLAHATMEPMNCVAQVGGGKTKLTFGSQIPSADQMNVGLALMTLPGSIEIETLFAGGSFGRRGVLNSDYVVECAQIAQKVGGGRPVKLVWTREDDMAAGKYRPLVHHHVKVELGPDGFPVAWRHRTVAQSQTKGSPMADGKLDTSTVEGVLGSPYLKATPNVDGQVSMPDPGVPISWWRSVGHTHTAFVMEHMIDRLAQAAGRDSVDYRRALYEKAGAKRHLAVLDLALEKAGPTPTPGWTRGLAVHESFGTVVAEIAEVKLENGRPRVGRVVAAVQCGIPISPDQIAAQIEGGVCYGLSAALYGQITLTDGVVDQHNFDTYRVLRIEEAPKVETYVVASTDAPTGVGEPGTPVIAPAVANALLKITGKPTGELPFVKA
jgi:isoquinoline 1-oxidoreductase subunit beta